MFPPFLARNWWASRDQEVYVGAARFVRVPLKEGNVKKATLPKELMCKTFDDLKRIGGKDDGGYLVSEADVAASTILLGFGINADWAFEKDFVEHNPVEVRAFDASTTFKTFLKQSLAFASQFKLLNAISEVFSYFAFKKFFTGKRVFYRKFVGLDSPDLFVPVGRVISETDKTEIFVKMDIEGFEYRCLDDLLEYQDRLSGIVIEFHDVDLHLQRIVDFTEKLRLEVAHVHANNYAPISDKGIPLVIEVTYSRHGEFLETAPSLPHRYDRPNKPEYPEIQIEFR